MRTNIDIDDDLLAQAMQAGPYTSKKETVEAGLRLLARQAAYREILKWEGKLQWEGDDASDWLALNAQVQQAEPMGVQEPAAGYASRPSVPAKAMRGKARKPGAKSHAGG